MTLFATVCCSLHLQAQEKQSINGYLVPMCIYNGDTIPSIQLPTVYIFKPLKFKNEKERQEYYRLIRNVKRYILFPKKLIRLSSKLMNIFRLYPMRKPAKNISNGLKKD